MPVRPPPDIHVRPCRSRDSRSRAARRAILTPLGRTPANGVSASDGASSQRSLKRERRSSGFLLSSYPRKSSESSHCLQFRATGSCPYLPAHAPANTLHPGTDGQQVCSPEVGRSAAGMEPASINRPFANRTGSRTRDSPLSKRDATPRRPSATPDHEIWNESDDFVAGPKPCDRHFCTIDRLIRTKP